MPPRTHFITAQELTLERAKHLIMPQEDRDWLQVELNRISETMQYKINGRTSMDDALRLFLIADKGFTLEQALDMPGMTPEQMKEYYQEFINTYANPNKNADPDLAAEENMYLIGDMHRRALEKIQQYQFPDFSQIKTVDERLASRLTWAGAFDLQLPKFEDKCAILRAKAELEDKEIEPEAIEYIAENVNTNIRDLEGEFNTILLMSEVRGLTPLQLIENGSVSVNRTSKLRPATPKQIVEKIAKYYNLTVKEMCGKSRVAHIKTARQVAMYILRQETPLSTNKIAAEVGVKDHSTVMHGISKIEKDLKLNFILRDQIEEIKEKIYG